MGAQFDISFVFSFLPKLLGTLSTTLLIVACSLLTGIIVGFLVALPRLYKVPVLKTISEIYISFFGELRSLSSSSCFIMVCPKL